MKAFKYCEYERCKNYKKRNLTLCYVHEKKTKSTVTLQLFFIITIIISMCMYLYVEEFNVYVNTIVSDYKQLVNTTVSDYKQLVNIIVSDYKQLVKTGEYDKYAYEIIDSFANNVSDTCIRVYNQLQKVLD